MVPFFPFFGKGSPLKSTNQKGCPFFPMVTEHRRWGSCMCQGSWVFTSFVVELHRTLKNPVERDENHLGFALRHLASCCVAPSPPPRHPPPPHPPTKHTPQHSPMRAWCFGAESLRVAGIAHVGGLEWCRIAQVPRGLSAKINQSLNLLRLLSMFRCF